MKRRKTADHFMKNKNVAALLALFIGSFGIHRFYLGQTGLGILYCILSITGISAVLGIIDFIAFLSMDEDAFDDKYNRNAIRRKDRRQYDTDYERPRRETRRREDRRENRREEYPRERKQYERPKSRYEEERRPVRRSRPSRAKTNPYKTSGLERYRDFEFEAAISDFKKALQIDANDIAVHFNMACAYSLTEEKDNAFIHLSRAVELGFVDFEKIKTHDALAYLRIQDEFDDFARKGYRLIPISDPTATTSTKEDDLANTSDLLEQLKKLGASCDWDRTSFTMDPDLYAAVIEVFIDLHKKGHIYRGLRMINWDPSAKTALSNEEVIHKEVNSKLYHVRYKIAGTDDEWVTIATTRPETILGDSAVCINPKDERYSHLHGKKVVIPMVNRAVPIILDTYVDIEFGTGCLKVTPAHDENDYELGKKHDLETIEILNADGTMSEAAQFYIGEDRFDVR